MSGQWWLRPQVCAPLGSGDWQVSSDGSDTVELLESVVEGAAEERTERGVDELPVGVIEGGDGHATRAADGAVQPVAARATDVLGEGELEDVVAFGHRTPVTVFVGVDEDEVDLAADPPGGVAELGELGVALGAPRREEVHHQRPSAEVGESDAPAAVERGQVERLGVDRPRAAAVV